VKSRSLLSLCLVSLFAMEAAYSQDPPPQELGGVAVYASTTDGALVLVPTFGTSSKKFSPSKSPDGEFILTMTKAQFCASLASGKPTNCSVNTYPAAPGIPSASGATWSGNGCGADPWSTALASGWLTTMLPGVFSGDLNRPVSGNPSIDFTSMCNQHDKGYTSVVTKAAVDNAFHNNLTSFCNASTNAQLCQGFAATYTQAVQRYGDAAYQEDQAELGCATWGVSMKVSQCSG
jgi:hypothetical protein